MTPETEEELHQWMEARASGLPMPSGLYPHLVICSADHRKPVGLPGCVCDKRYSTLRVENEKLRAQPKSLGLMSAKGKFEEELANLKAELDKLMDVRMQTAFVQGAQWWEWHKEAATMWDSDRNLAFEEAQKKTATGTLGKTVEELINESNKRTGKEPS